MESLSSYIDFQDKAGVYNDVSNFRDWIDATIETMVEQHFVTKILRYLVKLENKLDLDAFKYSFRTGRNV